MSLLKEFLSISSAMSVLEAQAANYAEQLARDVFSKNPDLDSSDAVIKVAYSLAKEELGDRAEGFFRDEDFCSDLASAYSDQKHGVVEGRDELQAELKTINQQLKDAFEEYKKNHQMHPDQYMKKAKELKDRREELIKQLRHGVAENNSVMFKTGDKVTVKNAKKYDSMATADKMPGVVDFIWPDGRIAVTVKVGKSTGQMNVDAGDLTYLQEAADPKSPEDYEELARKHTADGQRGTRSGMVYASMMAGRARRAAKILKDGGSQEAAWRHYQGTDVAEASYTAQEKARMRAAHEYNLDAAQREIDRRSAEGEDMTGATIDPNTYEIIKPKKTAVSVKEAEIEKETVKVPVGERPKGPGWTLIRAGKQWNEPVDTYQRKFKRIPPVSVKDPATAKTEVAESVYATDSEKLKAMPDLPVVIHKSPYEGSEVGEYTEIFVGSPKTAQQFAKYIIFKGGSARLGKRGQDIYVYHKGAGPITKRDFRMAKLEEGTGDPEEGWCVVSSDRPRIVIDGPHLDRETALKYKQSVSPAQSSGWFVLWGKEASDGSGEYVATRAVNPAEEVKEGFSEDDLAVGGTIIYKADEQYRMSKLAAKLVARKLKLMNGAVIDLSDVVSTDASDWSRFRGMRVVSGIKYPTEKIAEAASTAVRFKEKVDLASNAAASGRHDAAKRHLDAARSFMLGVSSTDMQKIQDAYETYKNLRKRYSGTGGDYGIKHDMVGTAKVVKEATKKLLHHVVSKLDGYVLASYATREEALKAAGGNPVVSGELETIGDHKFVKEAFKLGDRVKIVAGEKDAIGKEGVIGEIRTGPYRGAPKEFTVDYDYNEVTNRSKSITVSSKQIRALKLKEAAYADDLDPNKPIIVRGFRGMQSKPFKKRFKNMDALEAWLEDNGDDVQYDGMEVTNESEAAEVIRAIFETDLDN